MKRLFLTICFLILPVFVTVGQDHYGTTDVKYFRESRDREFRAKGSSPLLETDLLNFKGLEYFDITENFAVKAVFTKTPDEKYFLMPTSTGSSAKYVKVGILRFQIEGKDFQVSAYQNEKVVTDEKWSKKYGGSYFIPFRDLTNGKETYGGGRYIYLKIPEKDETILDFNLSFNPSCAYGRDDYSCPLPPQENFLRVKILAGEKRFQYTAQKP